MLNAVRAEKHEIIIKMSMSKLKQQLICDPDPLDLLHPDPNEFKNIGAAHTPKS
jgi:hypothetical protein